MYKRQAKKVWGVELGKNASKEEYALKGIEKLSEFIKELGLPTTLRELGATEDMLEKIADSTVLGGGYKKLTKQEVLEILNQAY